MIKYQIFRIFETFKTLFTFKKNSSSSSNNEENLCKFSQYDREYNAVVIQYLGLLYFEYMTFYGNGRKTFWEEQTYISHIFSLGIVCHSNARALDSFSN